MVATLKIAEKLNQKIIRAMCFYNFQNNFLIILSAATRRQDVMIRISGIIEFIDPNHLGFQESEVTLPPIAVGFQESGQETGATGTDCRNLHFHGPLRSPFFWNPAPLMQNYIIK